MDSEELTAGAAAVCKAPLLSGYIVETIGYLSRYRNSVIRTDLEVVTGDVFLYRFIHLVLSARY